MWTKQTGFANSEHSWLHMVNVAEPPVPSNLDTEHSNLHVLPDDTAEGMNIIVLGAAITACEAKWEAALQLFGHLAAGGEFSRFAAIILLDGFGLFPIYCTICTYLSISVYTLNSVKSYIHNFSPTVCTKHLTVNELGAGGQDGTKIYPEQPDQWVQPYPCGIHPGAESPTVVTSASLLNALAQDSQWELALAITRQVIVAWVHPPTKMSYVVLCPCMSERRCQHYSSRILLTLCLYNCLYIYIMFLSQSESLCLQVQEQKVDLNVIACSAVMSTRLNSSVWLQTSTCPWQALTCAARFVSSCFLFADPFRTVSFSTVGFTHDGTGCPQRFIDSISWFLTILGTFFFSSCHDPSLEVGWYLYAVPAARCLRERAAMVLGLGLSSFDARQEDGGHDMSQPWRSQCGCWGVGYASTVQKCTKTEIDIVTLVCFDVLWI